MILLASTSIIVICAGVLCLSDAELAWQLYEQDCRMTNVLPVRPRDRLTRVKQAGYVLIGLGTLGLIIGLGI